MIGLVGVKYNPLLIKKLNLWKPLWHMDSGSLSKIKCTLSFCFSGYSCWTWWSRQKVQCGHQVWGENFTVWALGLYWGPSQRCSWRCCFRRRRRPSASSLHVVHSRWKILLLSPCKLLSSTGRRAWGLVWLSSISPPVPLEDDPQHWCVGDGIL